MTFRCNGRIYRSAQMRKFQTGDPDLPAIYLTHDGRCTFVVRCDVDGDLTVHRAGTGEIIALARRYRLNDLLCAFPAAFAEAEIVSDPEGSKNDLVAGLYLGSGVAVPPAGARE